MKSRLSTFGLVLIMSALIFSGCGPTMPMLPTPTPPPLTPLSDQEAGYLTVPEVWEDAPSLAGQRVRIRGWKWFMHTVTLQRCVPASCDCNQSKGYLWLLEERLAPGDEPYRYPGMRKIIVQDPSLDCRGNVCYIVCTPFDPTSAEAFELAGRLRISSWDEQYKELRLEDLDVATSQQLIDEKWVPLETGQFTITLRAP
jgi:hypothetical protein